jgi:hypothetical protein
LKPPFFADDESDICDAITVKPIISSKIPRWEPSRTAFRDLIPDFNKPVKRMFTLLATWKTSCVVRTYVILARARGSRATRLRHQQHLAEHRSRAASSREARFRGELAQNGCVAS